MRSGFSVVCCFRASLFLSLPSLKSFHITAKFVLILWLTGFVNIQALAQVTLPSGPAGSDTLQAMPILTHAVVLLGGAASYGAIQDATVSATCTRTVAGSNVVKHVRWTISGDNTRYETDEKSGQGIVKGPSGDYRFVNGIAKPIEGRAAYAMQPFYLPGVMLTRVVTEPKYEATQEASKDTQTLHIRIRDLGQTEYPEMALQDWYFDATTGLPQRVAYLLPTSSNVHRALSISWYFTDYKPLHGVLTPTTLREEVEGGAESVCLVTAVDFNTAPPPSLFSVQNGGGQ